MAKTKKSRRKRPELYPTEPMSPEVKELAYGLMAVEGKRPEPEANEVPAEIPEPRSEWLANLRASTVSAQAQAAHTIAELQAWRDEIDSTIAFLKAQRND